MSRPTTILLAHDATESYRARLEARFPDLTFVAAASPDELERRLAEAAPEVAFSIRSAGLPGPVQRRLVDCPSLRWIQVGGAGVEHLLPWNPERLQVTNAAGLLSHVMAEYVIGAILMSNFGFPAYGRDQAVRAWKPRPWTEAAGKTLLVVGLGRIGRQTARLAKAVGLRVVGVRRSPAPDAAIDALLPPERLHDGLAQADFVVLHAPLTAETRGLIDAEALARMKPDALLINCARGPVVDQAALIEALERREIGGAVLDVFDEEPLPPDSPLWAREDVIVTPHVADSVADWQRRFADFFGDNLERWLAGRALENLVDPARGY